MSSDDHALWFDPCIARIVERTGLKPDFEMNRNAQNLIEYILDADETALQYVTTPSSLNVGMMEEVVLWLEENFSSQGERLARVQHVRELVDHYRSSGGASEPS